MSSLALWIMLIVGEIISPTIGNVTYLVGRANHPINIDGQLSESAWENAPKTEAFVRLGPVEESAASTTWAKMLWDDDYLYVAFYCEDRKLWATYQAQDDPLYEEDVVEIYIDPDGDGENYLEIEVNPLNTIFDLWLTKPRKQGGQAYKDWTMEGLKTAISMSGNLNDHSSPDEYWVCEMALPFEAMAFCAESVAMPPKKNDTWRVNLYRFDRASTLDPAREATGWSQTGGGQHVPGKFGKLVFSGEK